MSEVLVTMTFFAIMLSFFLWVAGMQCDAKWEGSGMETTYGFMKGCQIRLPSGTWIPAESYREIP